KKGNRKKETEIEFIFHTIEESFLGNFLIFIHFKAKAFNIFNNFRKRSTCIISEFNLFIGEINMDIFQTFLFKHFMNGECTIVAVHSSNTKFYQIVLIFHFVIIGYANVTEQNKKRDDKVGIKWYFSRKLP